MKYDTILRLGGQMSLQPMWKMVSFIVGARAEERKSSGACRGQISILVLAQQTRWTVGVGYISNTLTHVRMQVYIYMSIPFNAHSNDQTHTNWQLWGASMRITLTIIAYQSLITLKRSPVTILTNRKSNSQTTFHGQTAIQCNSWISIKLEY